LFLIKSFSIYPSINTGYNVRFEVLTPVLLKVQVFWSYAVLLGEYFPVFGRITVPSYSDLRSPRIVDSLCIKMKALQSFEMFGSYYSMTQCHNQKYLNNELGYFFCFS
jgi:hypothetical protein